MNVRLLILALILAPVSASAQRAGKDKPSGPYQICLWPNPCGRTLKPSTPPKAEDKTPKAKKPEAVPNLSIPTDPLSQAILKSQLTDGDDGIVSAVRLKPEQTGWQEDQILYRGSGSELRDAVADDAVGLPASTIPGDKRSKAKREAKKKWGEKVGSNGRAATQINRMRDKRRALRGSASSSKRGLDKMWGQRPDK